MPSDDFFIRRFARARDAGNKDLAKQIWDDACTRQYDLVKGLVRKHRFPGGSRLNAEDRQDAEIEAMTRIFSMGENFRGSTAPEFRAAIKRAVWFACMDIGRDVLAYEVHLGGSLDDLYKDSDGSRFDEVVERYLKDEAQQRADSAEALEEIERLEALIAWAIPQVKNESYRDVLELTFIEKLTGEEIADRLGITVENVYQRRSRAIRKLKEILDDHRP